MAGVPSEPQPLRVQDVDEHDGSLFWTEATADGGRGQVKLDEVLFILDVRGAARGQSGFIMCCLTEAVDQPAQPFRLLLLAADAVPDQVVGQHGISQMPAHLRSDDGNAVDVVVSTKAGLGQSWVFWQTVVQPLWSLAARVFGASPRAAHVVVTHDAHGVRQFARSLQDQACASRTVVLLSGDGGVADLLNGGDDAPAGALPPLVALLPLGTGNALFHSLHKPVAGPSPLVLGLRTLFRGAPARLPVFRASFSPGARAVAYGAAEAGGGGGGAVAGLYGAVVASYGFHASVVHESDTPEHRVHGARRFGMVARELLGESHAYRARLWIRRPSPSPSPLSSSSGGLEPHPRQTHAYVLVAMVSNLERTFAISPASEPLDGTLRLVHFGAVGGARTMDVMTRAYDGGSHVGMRWDDGEAVAYDEVDEVVIEALDADARWRKFCVDGAVVEVPEGGSMTVKRTMRELLRVLVDARVQQRLRGGDV